MSRDKQQWVIPAAAGVKDIHGRSRMVSIRIVSGRVVFSVSTAEDDDIVDTRAWFNIPNEVAEQLGYHLQSAAESNRQQRGEV